MGLTVAENVMLGDLPTRGRAVRWRAVRDEARGALSGLGIDIDVERIAGTLTVAEQTMVEVAREVRRGGRVLILDEPTACLSAKDADRIRGLVRTLRDDGVAVVYISHYIDEVMAVADRLTVLRDGEVVTTGPATGMDPASLVRSMVGRDVVSQRPERPAPKHESGLTVRGLSHGRAVQDFTVDVRRARSSPSSDRPGTPSRGCSTCSPDGSAPTPANCSSTAEPCPSAGSRPRSPAVCAV